MKSIYTGILCGGSGTRLWPVSSHKKPKQFIKIFNNKSLLQLTIDRCRNIGNKETIIIGSKDHKKLIDLEVNKTNVNYINIFEELGRNTAASVWFLAKKSYELDRNSKLLIMPSDHYIGDVKNFTKTINEAEELCDNFNWVVFGVNPSYPATGYGYIKVNNNRVKNFIEKPDLLNAQKLCEDDNVYWNAGIFFGYAKKILNSIDRTNNKIYSACQNAWDKKIIKNNNIFLSKNELMKIEKISIDYAVIENEKKIGFSTLDVNWSDVGTWDSISKFKELNTVSKNVRLINSDNNFIYSDDHQISIIDVDNIIVSCKGNKILITKKGSSEKVKFLNN